MCTHLPWAWLCAHPRHVCLHMCLHVCECTYTSGLLCSGGGQGDKCVCEYMLARLCTNVCATCLYLPSDTPPHSPPLPLSCLNVPSSHHLPHLKQPPNNSQQFQTQPKTGTNVLLALLEGQPEEPLEKTADRTVVTFSPPLVPPSELARLSLQTKPLGLEWRRLGMECPSWFPFQLDKED